MNKKDVQKFDDSPTALNKTLQILGTVFSVCVTFIKWWFIAIMFTYGTIFWLLDVWLGNGRNRIDPPWAARRRNQLDPNQVQEEIQNATVKDVLNKFGKQIEEADKTNKLAPEEKKVARKIKGLDRAAFSSKMREVLRDDEMETLFIIILKILGFELR